MKEQNQEQVYDVLLLKYYLQNIEEWMDKARNRLDVMQERIFDEEDKNNELG